MKWLLLLISASVLVGSCTYKHIEAPAYICDPKVQHPYSDIQPIIQSKCAINGCHNGTNSSIPTLVTEQQFYGNRFDVSTQLSNNAMPPAGTQPLTSFEKSQIICWINNPSN